MSNTKPHVLIVEDDPITSREMQVLVEDCQCEVLGPAADIDTAIDLIIEDGIDGAVLDVNLGDTMVWPVADALNMRNIPYVLVTGYSRYDLPLRYADRPFLAKPVDHESIQRELTALGLCVAGER